MPGRWTWVAAGLLAVLASSASAASTRRYANEECGLSVAFPAKAYACLLESGTHPHGFYFRLEGPRNTCGVGKPKYRTIDLYGDYNSGFQRTPAEAIAWSCRSGRRVDPAITRSIARLAFPGHRSERCAVREADGSIMVYVVTQADHWPGGKRDPAPEWQTPWINHTAYLRTRPGHLAEDLALFRQVLASVRLRGR